MHPASVLFVLLLAQSKPAVALTPADVSTAIREKGAVATLASLYQNEEKWILFLQGVQKANPAWLKIAASLLPGSSGDAHYDVVAAVGDALEKNPTTVFRLTIPPLTVEEICDGPEGDGATLFEEKLAQLRLRRRNVARIRQKNLQPQATKCLATLAEAEKNLRAFYGRPNK